MGGRAARLILAAAAALALTAGTARADVYDDNPSAASRGAGDLYVFARALDGSTLARRWTGSAWSSWSSLGGQATSGPGAAAYGSAINVFVRGTDGAVYQNFLLNGKWSGWFSLGGQATSSVGAVQRRGTNIFDIAVRGTNNAVWHRWFAPGQGWSGWEDLGGNVTSAPALNSQSNGILNIFVRGANGSIYQRSWDGSKWFDNWVSLGGNATSAPVAVTRYDGQLDLYVRGTDGALWQRYWVGAWSKWFRVDPGRIASGPGAVTDVRNHEIVFARNATGLSVKDWLSGRGWTPWRDFGPVAVPPPPPPSTPVAHTNRVHLRVGLRCTPPGTRLRVRLTVHKRPGRARAHVKRIVFFIKHGARKVDRHRPYFARLRLHGKPGSLGRVYARVYYRRSRHGKLHHKTVSRRYAICRG